MVGDLAKNALAMGDKMELVHTSVLRVILHHIAVSLCEELDRDSPT